MDSGAYLLEPFFERLNYFRKTLSLTFVSVTIFATLNIQPTLRKITPRSMEEIHAKVHEKDTRKTSTEIIILSLLWTLKRFLPT